MKKGMYFFWILTLMLGCKEKKKEADKHIDVFSYLKGQMRYIDTVPRALLKINNPDSNLPDSSYTDIKSVHRLVASFLDNPPNEDAFNDYFKQTVFGDATLGTITISYQNQKQEDIFERIDVYANPVNGDIRQVYILKKGEDASKEGKQQLLWTHNKGFSLITEFKKQDGSDSVLVTKIVWQ
jgi:hypothetical protein